ncbi:MAG: DUF4390 domain-containing protein [Thermodesulfovibrionales bacterium]|nr:DUF4390 domain-containing protein [Nitrospinota bacterium]MCG2709867.1 DUF4390 domain-containing protein [Thermodesulfovibrionales bacterium]MCG2813189.1 DUF4390 domain-containing protein [Thermodesulfovibrionales bacterium]MDP3048965.1 DUF4390 domain-containing protein [Thermodesulfovibrionales bacterium]
MRINFFRGDVKAKLIDRRWKVAFCFLLLFCCLLFFPSITRSAEIIGPETKIINNEIYVTTGLILDEKQLQDLKNGIAKEITFYIDLFRVWNMWPDEFVLGKTIVKTLRVDPVKKEYVAASSDGMTIVERRFNELDSLLNWSLSIRDLKLTNIRELEPDDYFVRITVESRLRKLPPVISYLFFFVPEKEFTKVKDSSKFRVGQEK